MIICFGILQPITMENPNPCCICNKRTHRSDACPELYAPLKNEDFFRPVGGRPAAGDDDDEKLMTHPTPSAACRTPFPTFNHTNLQDGNPRTSPGVLYLL